MRTITHIMLHHSATQDSGTVSWTAIEKFHKETQGWNDIGYHFGIELVINPYINHYLSRYKYQALLGRPVSEFAAACPQGDMNRKAIHICCVGDYDLEIPEDTLYERLVHRLVRPLVKEYKISINNIVGHRNFNPAKSCPGKNFDIEKVKFLLK